MSTDQAPREADAEVIQLRAAEAPTEAKLDQTPAPAYIDVTDGAAQRKPIVPAHLRDGPAWPDSAAGFAVTCGIRPSGTATPLPTTA
jgi:hypothetical protein